MNKESLIVDSSETSHRIEKLNQLKKSGIEPFAYNFARTHLIKDIVTQYRSLVSSDLCHDVIRISGRLIAKRGHGKALFGNLLDDSGTLQFYINVESNGDEIFNQVSHLDIGDIIGIEGIPFRTKRGELSIKLEKYILLTKSLHSLPEKFHGLQDKETRYRQRYVDLIANADVKEVFKKRSQIILNIRKFLESKNFIEVETPMLQNVYGGATAKPFVTVHNDLKQSLFLRIALELPLKRLIVGGFERIFEIGRVFRNEGVSYKHNPEYTLLELYQAYADYNDIMALTESLIADIVLKTNGSYILKYNDHEINLTPPFKRITLKDAILAYANVDISDHDALKKKALSVKSDIVDLSQKGELINIVYDHFVEPHLIQPTFILDYPIETSPLAKRHRDNPELVERFELFINGMEVANAFSELNDPIDQYQRFMQQVQARELGWEEAHMMDEDYIKALEYGMPPTGGLGIGIDRIVMLLTHSHSIRDVLFFPHMKDK